MLTLGATANHVIALQYLCMFNESNVFILFHFLWGCYGGALVFLGGAGAPASPSLAPPMNEEMASQNHHLHLCNTDTENTSLLVNNSNISLLFPPDTFKLYCMYLKQNSSAVLTALCCCRTLNTVETLSVATRSPVVSTSAAIFFHH